MKLTISPAQLEQLRRNAKRLARDESIPLHEAQARIAADSGFRNWSLLARGVDAAQSKPQTPTGQPVDIRRRHYLHGDQSETDGIRYYCAMCDQMVPAEHFKDGSHDLKKSIERYVRSIRNFEAWTPTELRNWRRPDDAANLLDEDVTAYHAAQAAKEASRSRFHRWILTQTRREDAIGDLARDIESDKDFPVAETSLEALIDYMDAAGAIDDALKAMRAAHAKFRRLSRASAS